MQTRKNRVEHKDEELPWRPFVGAARRFQYYRRFHLPELI
jgi:hypothetical protein